MLAECKCKRDRIKSSRTVIDTSSSVGVAGRLENSQPPAKREKQKRKYKAKQEEMKIKLAALG